MTITIEGLSKRYGDAAVLDALTLSVEPKSFTVLCGPTGVGKTVLFRLLVGLEKPDAGRIMLGGNDITGASAAERPIGYVPQSFALYPHLTVGANIGYPLKLARRPSAEIAKRVDWAAGVLAITHLLDKTPDQLSGGEKQRTAVARGLLKDCDLFILDDPLVGLDYKLRERLMDELKGIQRELGATFLYATSDSLEALTMAQTLAVFDGGHVVQMGDVFDVYRDPRHRRAMELIGFPKANMLTVGADGRSVGPFTVDGLPTAAGAIGIRPEALRLDGSGALNTEATIQLVEDLGGERVVYVEAGGHTLTVAAAANDQTVLREGERVTISTTMAALTPFAADTGLRLTGTSEGAGLSEAAQ